jgi:molecular chaperone GrpE
VDKQPDAPGAGEEAANEERTEVREAKSSAQPSSNDVETVELRDSLQRKESQCAELHEALLRKQAEFENYRKRMVREQTQFLERAVEGFVLQLLPIIDNLERAILAAEEKHDLAQLSSGVGMVHGQLVDLFVKEGIEIINPEGEQFDPTKHHAMMQVEDAGRDDEAVVEVVQKGYALKGKILRPAMVKVNARPTAE